MDQSLGQIKGFDAFSITLGDRMRGERATLGKSLLDVQRDLRISAEYLDAIESASAERFETRAFIAGYVRSYAKYLGMNPEEALKLFCEESGFHAVTAPAKTKTIAKETDKPRDFALPVNLRGDKTFKKPINRDIYFKSPLQQNIEVDGFFARLDIAAVGSLVVLAGLMTLVGYGGWALVREVQTVQIVPVEEVPVVVTDLALGRFDPEDPADSQFNALALDTQRASLDRLYEPQALDVPVVMPRDAPIAMLDPSTIGVFGTPVIEGAGGTQTLLQNGAAPQHPNDLTGLNSPNSMAPQVTETLPPSMKIIAVEAAWMRVVSGEGNKLFEDTLAKGETYEVPLHEQAPILRTGMSGFVYVQTQNGFFGPLGKGTSVARSVPLDQTALEAQYPKVDPNAQSQTIAQLAELVAPAAIAE